MTRAAVLSWFVQYYRLDETTVIAIAATSQTLSPFYCQGALVVEFFSYLFDDSTIQSLLFGSLRVHVCDTFYYIQ